MAKHLKVVLLLLLVALVAASTVVAASDVEQSSAAEEMRKAAAGEGEEEGSDSWTTWAKDKISEGLGFKNQQQLDEEEAARKAGEGVKSAREKAQEMASGNNKFSKYFFLFLNK